MPKHSLPKRDGAPSNARRSSAHQADAVAAAPARLGTEQSESPNAVVADDGKTAVSLFKNRSYLEELQKDLAPVLRSLLYCERQCELLARADSIALALPRSLPSEMRNTLLAVVRLPHLREHMTPDELRALDAIMGQGIDFGCKSDEDVPAALLRVKEYALRFGEAATSMRYLELRILAALSEMNTGSVVDVLGESARQLDETPPAIIARDREKAATAGFTSGGAGGAPPDDDSDRYAGLAELEPAHQKAYLSFLYAETKTGRRLEDREAWEWLSENGIDETKEGDGLHDYVLPILDTWARYLRQARNATGEQKYTPRTAKLPTASVVRSDQVERQTFDED